MMEKVITTGTIRRAKLQSQSHYQHPTRLLSVSVHIEMAECMFCVGCGL